MIIFRLHDFFKPNLSIALSKSGGAILSGCIRIRAKPNSLSSPISVLKQVFSALRGENELSAHAVVTGFVHKT